MLCSSSTPEVPPPCCLAFLRLHLPFPGRKSEHQPQENVSQAQPSICLCHWHPQGAPSQKMKNLVPGEGQMASHQPVTALRTLEPTLGFLSETGLPMSLHPPCPWQSTQSAMPCQPMSWERYMARLPLPPACCHFSSTVVGLPQGCTPGPQASNLLSGRLTEDRQGWGCLPSSLPRVPCPRPG